MKLLSKYYRANITATAIVVILSSICYYFTIHYILLKQLDNSLKVEEQEVYDYVKENNALPEPTDYHDQQVNYKKNAGRVARNFSTHGAYDKEERENILVRQLSFSLKVGNNQYEINISKSQEETEDLIQLIVLITLGILVLLLLVIFLLNRLVLQRLWKPFNATINQLTGINFTDKTTVSFQHSNIDEFNNLNKAVAVMMEHLSQEYEILKNFTENASHEMQTPLAIINSKLDLLMQDEGITEKQFSYLQPVYMSLERLSKLNQSLLLLAKIGNGQFQQKENIRLDNIIHERHALLEEIAGYEGLQINYKLEPVIVNCNRYLLEILVSNLMNNAMRYNVPGGSIAITLYTGELVIANSSSIPELNSDKIFQRFYRHAETGAEGNGLGLSIIQQICDSFGFTIRYYYREEKHFFKISFNGITFK